MVRRAKGRNKLACHFHCHINQGTGSKEVLRHIYWKLMLHNTLKISVSNGVKHGVERYSPKNNYTVYNSVETQRLKQHGEQSEIVHNNSVLMMGNFYQIKGCDIASLAIQTVNTHGHEAHLYIACDKPEEVYSYLRNYVPDDFISKYIHCIPTRNDIAAYYTSSKVFLSPSRNEAFSVASVEAAWCGCYTVCSKTPGQSELQVPGIRWVSDPNVHSHVDNEIADLLISYFEAPELVYSENIKAQDKLFIEENYSMKKWAIEIVDILSKY